MVTTGSQEEREFMFILKKIIIIVNTYWLIPVVRGIWNHDHRGN